MDNKIHRGELIKEQIKKKGYSIQDVAIALNYGRNAIYKWIDQPNLSLVKVKAIFDFLNVDMRDFFSNEELGLLMVEPQKEYPSKYVQLLEKYTMVMEENAEYRKIYGELPGQYRDNQQ